MGPRLPSKPPIESSSGRHCPIATFRPHKSRGTWSLSSGPPLPKQAGLICLNMNSTRANLLLLEGGATICNA